MLITRGFGTATGGTGLGENVYVPILEPNVNITESGYKIIGANTRVPSFSSGDNKTNPPEIETSTIKTDLNVYKLQPKISTNLPKF